MAALLAGLLAGLAVAQPSDNLQAVTIAVAGPMMLRPGQVTRDAVQFAVDRINRQGLHINGKSVEIKLLMIDDKNDRNLAVLGAHSAVAAGVVGVIGHLSTDASIAASPVYNQAGIPQLTPTAGGKLFVKQGYNNVFQVVGKVENAALYLADISVKTLAAQRILLVDNGTVLGQELSHGYSAAIRHLGGNIVDSETLNEKSSDFNSVIAKMKHGNVDLVFFAGVVPQSLAFAARLHQLGLTTQLLLSGGAVNTDFPSKTGEYADGTVVVMPGIPIDRVPDFKQLEKTYTEKYTTQLIPQSWIAYDAVQVLVEAMRRTNSLNPRILSTYLHEIKYSGLSGTISFTEDGTLETPHYTVYRAEQGTWKAIKLLP